MVDDDAPASEGVPTPRRMTLRYRTTVGMRRPTTVLGLFGLVLFGYLIVVPIVTMLVQAATVSPKDTVIVQQPAGSPTSYYLWRVFLSPVAADLFWRPLLHTVIVSVCSVVLSLRGRRGARVAVDPHRHGRPPLVHHGLDRPLHAADVGVRTGLEHDLQEPHGRWSTWLARVHRDHAARLARVRRRSDHHHLHAVLRPRGSCCSATRCPASTLNWRTRHDYSAPGTGPSSAPSCCR